MSGSELDRRIRDAAEAVVAALAAADGPGWDSGLDLDDAPMIGANEAGAVLFYFAGRELLWDEPAGLLVDRCQVKGTAWELREITADGVVLRREAIVVPRRGQG